MADGLPKRILKVCQHWIISELWTFMVFFWVPVMADVIFCFWKAVY